MPKPLLALAALLVIPLAASADDAPLDADAPAVADAPAAEAPAVETTATITTTTTTTSAGTTTTTTTTTTSAPGNTAPAAPPPAVYEDPCHAYKHGRWRQRLAGRLSIGFSKSRIHLRDEGEVSDEGKLKTFVVRLNGRRGWSLELEAGKLKLDSGDSARLGAISLVKTFGKRRLAPYVLAGGGGGRYETVDGVEQKLRFGEVGAGVMLRKKRFSIGIDVRRGVRAFEDEHADQMPATERASMPTGGDEHAHDHYTRGRVLALMNF